MGGPAVGQKSERSWCSPKVLLNTLQNVARGSVPVGHDNELIYGGLLGLEAQVRQALSNRVAI